MSTGVIHSGQQHSEAPHVLICYGNAPVPFIPISLISKKKKKSRESLRTGQIHDSFNVSLSFAGNG